MVFGNPKRRILFTFRRSAINLKFDLIFVNKLVVGDQAVLLFAEPNLNSIKYLLFVLCFICLVYDITLDASNSTITLGRV